MGKFLNLILVFTLLLPLGCDSQPVVIPQSTSQSDIQADLSQRYIYLGRWQWVTEGGMSFWRMPRADIGLGCLDLRSIPQMSKAGGIPEGYGIFVTSAPDNKIGTLLGQTITTTLNTVNKNALRTTLGITDTLKSSSIVDILWELFTQRADITGQTRWKPIMPTSKGVMELHLGGFSLIKSEQYDSVKHPLVMEQVKLEYTQLRQAELGKSEHYRRVLDALSQKYKVDWREIAGDTEPPLPHETTITDNFNRANADALGTSSEGWSWTETLNDQDILNNQVVQNGVNISVEARAESDLSSSDHYAQADMIAFFSQPLGSAINVSTRYSSSALTFYGFYSSWFDAAQFCHFVYKCVGGAYTLLTPLWLDGSKAVPHTLNGSSDGSTHTLYRDGVQKGQVTDSSIPTGLRTGIGGYCGSSANLLDNFEAGDLATSTIESPFIPPITVL